ncbi:MAG: LTA synthase family protein [Lachnospiraceae bacterium]|nr:LTA synthase family protein [Lachnospiraceae bacterium]
MSFNKVRNPLLYILIPALIMYLFEAYTHNPFVRMKAGIQILNILLFILINTLLFFLTGRLKLSLRIMCIVFAVFGLAEYYLVEFRGVTLLPWDLGSLGTAAEVAGGYDYIPGRRALLCLAGFLLLFLISGFADLKTEVLIRDSQPGFIIRLIGVLLSFGAAALYTGFVQTEFAIRTFGFYTKLFTPTAISERDGTLTAFLMELQYLNVEKPGGYSAERAEEILNRYEPVPCDEKKANIIVVMNEAFSDPAVLGDIETNEDYMPFVHSLLKGEYENAVTGELNVSIVGGNTPNSEFEFLTGDSLLFLPEGSIPYQQYVDEGIYAMPAYLRDMGYATVGMHPYYEAGWERDRVYPELGFERELFIRDFDAGASRVRDYISDMACSEQIIKEYERNLSSNGGKPLFAFCVTMQNHSPYDREYENLPDDIDIKNDEGIKNIGTTERYLSLIKRSDEAFRYLTEYFAGKDDPTVIVMYGDHQPSDSVVRPVWELNGRDSRNLSEEEVEKRYIVPYVIWANFDIEGRRECNMSANFLGNMTLLTAGAGLDGYRAFLNDLYSRYPVLSAVRTMDAEGRRLDDASIREDRYISEYRILQYYELFDR